MIVSCAYVEIDALLDTRLAVAMSIDPARGKLLEEDARYLKRVNNSLEEITGIPDEEFNQAYRDRTYESVSPHWRATDIVRKLAKDFLVSVGDSSTYKEEGETKLVVNTYPYTVDEEAKELLIAALTRTTKASEVELVSKMPELVTPSYLRGLCNTAVIYEYDTWFNIHYKELGDSPMPTTALIHPYIMVGETDRPHFMIVDEAQRVFKAAVDLRIMPLGDFSVTKL